MKCKLYLRMVLATMTALFVATGCSSGTDEPIEPVGPVDVPVTFELQVSNVGTGEATVAVKPSKLTAMYYCDAITKTAFDAYATDEAFLAADIKRLEAIATAEKMTLKAYLEAYGNRGEKNVTVKTTEPKTAYYAYVYGIKNDGTVISKVFKAEFTSGDAPVTPKFELSVAVSEIAQTTATISATVSDETTPYFFAVMSDADYKALGGTPETAIPAYLALLWKQTQDKNPGVTIEDIVEANVSRNNDSYQQKGMTADSKYWAYGAPLDAKGVPTQVGIVKEFKTLAGGGGTGLELTLGAVTPGDKDGKDPETSVTTLAKSTGAVSAKWGGFAKTAVDKALADGATLVSFMDTRGQELPAANIPAMNSADGIYLTTYGIPAGMEVTLIVRAVDAQGNMTAKAVSGKPSSGGGGDGKLTFTFAVTEITATAAKIRVTPSNNTDTYYFDVLKSSQIAGMSDAELVTALGENPSKYPSKGTDGYDPSAFEKNPLVAGVEYTVFAFGYASGAATTPVAKSTFTPTGGGGGEPTDAYKAWLGTWTVKSTKNEVNSTPVSFDVTFSQKAANSTYKVIGWGINGNRLNDQVAMTFNFDSATGGFKAMNGVVVANIQTPDKLPGTVEQTLSYLDPSDGKYYVLPGNLTALTATMKADKASASVVSGTFTFKDDPTTYTVSSLDLGIWSSDHQDVWSWKPAEGFTNPPVGPYTMTKKSGASAPAKSMGVNTTLRSVLAVNKNLVAKTAVVASNIPQLSSALKLSSMSKASNGLNVPSFKAEMNASALEVAPMSAKATIYKAIPME